MKNILTKRWGFAFLVAFSLSGFLNAQTPKTERQYLSGTDKDHTVAWKFFCSEGRNSGKWTTIEVPSCWEQQGFGSYNYGTDAGEPAKEHGLYKHEFHISDKLKDKSVKLVFEGVMTDASVKVNGKSVGAIHQGAFYEFSYDISHLLKYGETNLLEVRVDKVSANASINHAEREADFWVFGGIYRPVYLSISPKEHIERVAIDAQADGTLKSNVYLSSKKAQKLTLNLLDISGNKIQELPIENIQKEKHRWSVKTKASGVKTWNPEQPNLYQLQFTISDKKGNFLHTVTERIGFRTVEVLEGDGIYLNGSRIKFKGVNRHSFHPESGRTTSKEISLRDVQMMKDMNMNAVRMSHYPPDKHFLEVADSLGLFVIDEVCTWHNPMLDTEVARKLVKETVVRDVNHPSIILWANGNEQGWNPEVDADYSLWDIQQREVIHPWSVYNKTNTIHYSAYHSLINDAYTMDKILFPTEFLHGMYDGGHGSGLEDYWNIMWNLPLSAGGFLWDFADQGIVRTDKGGIIDLQGNKANDGIVGPYGEREASYFTIKEIWSPLHIEERFITPDFNGIFRIENRYHFTNLSDVQMTAQWLSFDGSEKAGNMKVLAKGEVQLPALNPAEKGSFTINRPVNWQSADALHLTATDAYGKEMFTWSYPVATPKESNKKHQKKVPSNTLSVTKTEGSIQVTVGQLQYEFSQENGLLQKVLKNGKTIPLNNGPIILGQNDKIVDQQLIEENDKVEIRTVFEPKEWMPAWSTVKEKRSDIIHFTVHANGLLDVRVEFKGFRNLTGYRGVSFSFPETEVAGMQWLGDGPYRVWRNRTKGTKFQVWQNDYNNTVTGEADFVYPEFKGFFSNLYWSNVKGKSQNGFTVYCHTPHTYLRMLTPQEPKQNKKGKTHPEFPEGDISFVMNIPAMGTKFHKAEALGPHGNSEHYFGNDDKPITLKLTFQF